MNKELRNHLYPLLGVFLVTSLYWLIIGTAWYQYLFLFTGLLVGSFFLDLDHIIYWLYLNPNIEESRLAKLAIFKYDFRSVLKLLESTSKNHTSLIFHHFFFQVVLALISFFVFTSTTSVFAMAFILALNIHLIVDEYEDLLHHKDHLQDWLFAREDKQLPVGFLGKYVAIFTGLSAIFFILLLRANQ